MTRIFLMLAFICLVSACAAPTETPLTIAPTPATAIHPPATVAPVVTITTAPTLAPTHAPKPTQAPLKTDEHRAPNGWWSAQGWGEFRGDKYLAELRVARADGQVLWTASQEWNAGLGVPLPTPLEWSQDGRYLYYTNVPLVDGCALFVNGSDLWRMDLTDGSATQLVPEVGLAVSLSPDEQIFAYVSFGPQPELVLRDLATGEERRAPLPADTQAGGLVWSLDSSVMMLTVAERPCSGEEEHTIVRVDVITLEQKIVLADNDRPWVSRRWAKRGMILLVTSQAGIWLNPSTGETREDGPQQTDISPNSEWIAMVMERVSEDVELGVIKANGSQVWTVKENLSSEGSLWPIGWSRDGNYLYFTHQLGGDGCGGAVNGTDLWRMDLRNGYTTEIISATQSSFLALSPDSRTLAFKDNEELVVHDLATGRERRQRIEAVNPDNFTGINDIVWSPDSHVLMIMLDVNCEETASLVRVEADTLIQTVLIHEDMRWFTVVGWLDTEKVLLRGRNNNYWLMDSLTGALTTPTLVPQTLNPN